MNTPLTPLRRRLLLLAAVSCLPVQGAEFAFDLLPEVENQQLGANFAAAGDVDGDGTADVAIADPGYKANGFLASGVVFIMSGADGSHLRTYLPESSASSQYFGIALASLDANGDGTTDLAVGSPGYTGSTGYGTGTVRVFSGTDGALLSVAYGLAGFQFGGAITNAGDQNGDGCEDLYVGASMAYGNRGAVFVQSGLDGTILRTVQAEITFTTFATSLATVGDIDGDGKADVAVGAPGYRVSSNYLGRVLLIRSSDGVTATQLVGTGTGPRFGYTLASVPDANGDGIGDLMAGTYSGGVALLLSGADLTTIRDLSVTGLPNFQAVNVGGALDFDDDGLEDYLIGSPALNLATVPASGGIRVISGADQSVLFEQLATGPSTGLGHGMKPLKGFGLAFGESSLTDAQTGGRGIGHFWNVIHEEVPPPPSDTDGDGFTDDVDSVVNSIMDATVSILGVNSTVANRVDSTGTTLADRYAALPAPTNPRKPGPFIASVACLTVELVKGKAITSKEGARLVAAAAAGVVRGIARR